MGILSSLGTISTPYKIIGGLIITLSLCGGIWLHGYNKGKAVSQVVINQQKDSISSLTSDLLVAKGQTKIVPQIVTKYVDRIVTIHDKSTVVQQSIKEDVKDKTVTLSAEWTCIHNAAITGTDPSKCHRPKSNTP